MDAFLNLLFKIRAVFMRTIKPSFLYHIPKKSLKPMGSKFGFDRGSPIDRYWIEDFLKQNKKYIRGACLEITDDKYTKKYGGTKISKSDVLDINFNNKKANIHADLKDLSKIIKNNAYDCIILTHVLGLIDNYDSVLKECNRILKPGGALLFTGSSLGPALDNNVPYWRFTKKSVNLILKQSFKAKKIKIKAYGNILAAHYFLAGMSQEDLTAKELSYYDPRFDCVIAAIAIK